MAFDRRESVPPGNAGLAADWASINARRIDGSPNASASAAWYVPTVAGAADTGSGTDGSVGKGSDSDGGVRAYTAGRSVTRARARGPAAVGRGGCATDCRRIKRAWRTTSSPPSGAVPLRGGRGFMNIRATNKVRCNQDTSPISTPFLTMRRHGRRVSSAIVLDGTRFPNRPFACRPQDGGASSIKRPPQPIPLAGLRKGEASPVQTESPLIGDISASWRAFAPRCPMIQAAARQDSPAVALMGNPLRACLASAANVLPGGTDIPARGPV